MVDTIVKIDLSYPGLIADSFSRHGVDLTNDELTVWETLDLRKYTRGEDNTTVVIRIQLAQPSFCRYPDGIWINP